MKRILFQFFYLFRQSLLHFRHRFLLHSMGLATIGLAFLIVVIFGILYQNLEGAAVQLGKKVSVTIFLREGFTSEDVQRLEADWRRWKEIDKIQHVSKEEALVQFKRELGDKASLLENLPENPLPAYFEISLKNPNPTPAQVKQLAGRFLDFPQVEEVHYGQGWTERFLDLLTWFRWGWIGLAIALCFACLLIIANTIRLSVFTRREEIEIMQLVGATRSFIRIPFLFEGVVLGMGGAAIALGLAWGLYQFVLMRFGVSWALALGFPQFSFLSVTYLLGLMALGAIVGCFGSFFSIGRFLKS
jgi:cell division transport system permease protein